MELQLSGNGVRLYADTEAERAQLRSLPPAYVHDVSRCDVDGRVYAWLNMASPPVPSTWPECMSNDDILTLVKERFNRADEDHRELIERDMRDR